MTGYIVQPGETSAGVTVNSGDVMAVSGGGESIGTTVNAGGYEYVSAGGLALDTTVNLGGEQFTYHGARVSGAVVHGTEIDYGATFSATIDGADEIWNSAVDLVVNDGGEEFVSNFGIDIGATVNHGGRQDVVQSGTASGVTLDGGTQAVETSATATGTTVNAGGIQYVFTATVISTTVNSDGQQVVGYDGTASGTIVNGGGEQLLQDGIASATQVNNGGFESVSGLTFDTTVYLGGVVAVLDRSSATSTTVFGTETLSGFDATSIDAAVQRGGEEIVYNLGVASGLTVYAGGSGFVSSGGSAVDATVESNGELYLYFGGRAFGITVNGGADNNSGGIVHVSGGLVTSTTINGGLAAEIVEDGGTSVDTLVHSQGEELVYSAGTASGAVVEYGGTEKLEFHGRAFDTTLDGGRNFIDSGSKSFRTTINDRGFETVLSGGMASGTTVNGGGTEYVMLGGTIIGTTLNIGGAIDLAGEVYVSGGTATLDSNTDILTIVLGTNNVALQLAGNYAGESFNLQPDSSGDTLVTVGATQCYRLGTRLRTDRGDVAVEDLAIDDRLIVCSGDARPISWIGRRQIDCRRHPKPETVWPVRIRAGALGHNLPCRDLWLSPDHAVFIDDVLIPIRNLLAGGAIARVPVDEVTYFHVELPEHGLLLAEGMWAESYLDAGDRANFANGRGAIRLFPDFATRPSGAAALWETLGCAALVVTGPRLEAARRQVEARAASMPSRDTAECWVNLA